MSTVTARCPVRIDLAGGTTDIWPLPLVLGGEIVTVNAALDLPAQATVAARTDDVVSLASRDQDRQVQYDDTDALRSALADGTCPLPLLGLAATHGGPTQGLTIVTEAGSPDGAGLGGSSALLVALVGALASVRGDTPDPTDHLALAQDIETSLLKTPTGFQDYHPPLHGGCLALHRHVGGLTRERLPVDLAALERRLRIVYTGVPHHSGITNWGVVRAVFDGDRKITEALRHIGHNAAAVRDAFAADDVDSALAGVLEDGRLRTRLGEHVVTPEIEALDRAVREVGALGTKVLGAGGGGCVLVVLAPGDHGAAVDRAIAGGPGQAIPVHLTESGMTISRA